MSDLLTRLNRNPATSALVKALGLPDPPILAREAGGYVERPLEGRHALLLRTEGGFAADALAQALGNAGATLLATVADDTSRFDVVALDATGCAHPNDFGALYEAFHPIMRRIARNGRVLVAAANPASAASASEAAVARGIEGFVRSLAKELGPKGIVANLAYVQRDALDRLDGPVRFFCGVQSTYVTGQVFELTPGVAAPVAMPAAKALAGKVALVTGAAKGIGMATAERLAQEGAQVVALDMPGAADDLHNVCLRIGAVPLMMDISALDSPARLYDFLTERFGGVDIVVHNAGITRDRTLANMKRPLWDMVINVNLAAVMEIDEYLLTRGALRDGGRIVCLSSVSGVAGNFGQTNYAASKAALIGYVAAQAPRLAARGICINAVAPGFIETAMTDAMPFMTREVGRRLNSLKQGGQPRDVAELITFLATPGAYGISGATIRVCGQGIMGA
jgi:3-oxoacyl-[acyl-carrier protein] reductase